MSRTSEIAGRKKKQDLGQSIEMDVNFRCQVCHEDVDKAKNYFNDGLFIWVCSQGHASQMELSI